ncbi:MAG: PQQ-like beta-propeller repeat protein, partial [Planctomycetales bacterium]|nr:PQQ-like beta-propeller repeat protein [Planctomycetales bacterium]
MFRGNPQQTGSTEATLPDRLAVRWKATAPDGVSSTAAIVGGVVYVGSDGGELLALDLATGAERWRFKATEAIRSSPTVAEGVVYFGDGDGVFFAVSAADGAEKWRFDTQGEIISSAHVVDVSGASRVVFGSYDGNLYCLSTDSGKVVWRFEMADRVHGAAAIVDGAALASGCDGFLHIIDLKDGVARANVELGAPTPASPAVENGRAIFGVYDESVVCVDIANAKVAW